MPPPPKNEQLLAEQYQRTALDMLIKEAEEVILTGQVQDDRFVAERDGSRYVTAHTDAIALLSDFCRVTGPHTGPGAERIKSAAREFIDRELRGAAQQTGIAVELNEQVVLHAEHGHYESRTPEIVRLLVVAAGINGGRMGRTLNCTYTEATATKPKYRQTPDARRKISESQKRVHAEKRSRRVAAD